MKNSKKILSNILISIAVVFCIFNLTNMISNKSFFYLKTINEQYKQTEVREYLNQQQQGINSQMMELEKFEDSFPKTALYISFLNDIDANYDRTIIVLSIVIGTIMGICYYKFNNKEKKSIWNYLLSGTVTLFSIIIFVIWNKGTAYSLIYGYNGIKSILNFIVIILESLAYIIIPFILAFITVIIIKYLDQKKKK